LFGGAHGNSFIEAGGSDICGWLELPMGAAIMDE
jgi:hypothetical protein